MSAAQRNKHHSEPSAVSIVPKRTGQRKLASENARLRKVIANLQACFDLAQEAIRHM
jgi:hypothetical protein